MKMKIIKSCNHKTRGDRLRDTQMKNRANVYKLQWDLRKNLVDWDMYSEHARQTYPYAKVI